MVAIRQRIALAGLFAILCVCVIPAACASYMFAGSSNGGYYSINTDTGVCTLLASGTAPNHMGYDPVLQRIVYSYNSNDNWAMYSRTVTYSAGVPTSLGSETLITANVRTTFGSNWPGGVTSTLVDLTGAADFGSNGTYYFIPDEQGGEATRETPMPD